MPRRDLATGRRPYHLVAGAARSDASLRRLPVERADAPGFRDEALVLGALVALLAQAARVLLGP